MLFTGVLYKVPATMLPVLYRLKGKSEIPKTVRQTTRTPSETNLPGHHLPKPVQITKWSQTHPSPLFCRLMLLCQKLSLLWRIGSTVLYRPYWPQKLWSNIDLKSSHLNPQQVPCSSPGLSSRQLTNQAPKTWRLTPECTLIKNQPTAWAHASPKAWATPTPSTSGSTPQKSLLLISSNNRPAETG